MKKKLFVVYGTDSDNEKALTPYILEDLEPNQICVIRLKNAEPYSALKNTLDALRPHEKNYDEIFVAYSGDNLHLLSDNLPCQKIDMAQLRRKITNEIGGAIITGRDYKILAQTFSKFIIGKINPV